MIKFENNILKIDGKERFLMSGDYPYYRDSADMWDKKLKNIKNIGIDIITIYIPWIHHCFMNNGDVIYDFLGKRCDNTNLHEFLRLVEKNKIYCIVKPGPFVHAELRNGGIPDFIIDKKYEGIWDRDGNAQEYMGRVLPNILDKNYKS